ncbi:PapD-like protein [Polychytrium aggregatum]|uniref:PapD-like protein n=1 Tax=Polychytrium aggregatum TaxID=110093 RepID=UPI0022FF3AA1|nr:PapD-like protein [Polychytrium aggregatum]KAI9199445.1 PapD-like protein [Polychytrium aggregatum]
METAKPGSPTNSSPRTLGIPAITVQDSPLQIAPPIFVFAASRIHVGYISRITLTNTSASAAVAFKFKTNAPTRYSVKPVYGILEPSKSMEVLVRCESSLESQDRFQLQVVTLQSEETARFASTSWKSVAATRIKDLLLDCRLMQNTTPGPTVGRKASQELKAEKPSNPTIKFHDAPPPYTPQGTNSAPAMIHSSPYMGVPQSSPGIALYTPTQEKADPPMLSGWRQISIFQLVLIAILCIALGVVLDYKSAAVTLEQMMRW